MTSVIYASLTALLVTWLSLNVIRIRRKYQVSIGDGRKSELKIAMAAQSNAIEYIPITLLLLFALEYNGASMLIVHLLGLSLLAGRIIHARGILSETMNLRIVGMHITIYTLIGLSVINFVFLPYTELFRLS